jgi:hypothetical protein
MKNQFVTYEIAKRLKGLGFNESCLMYWKDIDGKFYLSHKGEPSGIGTFDECDFYNQDGFPLKDTGVVTAPLWQQAIDWLREKHGLVLEILHDETSDLKYVIEITKYHGPCEFEKIDIPQKVWGYYRDYNEAREAAILKALKRAKQPA